MKKRRNIWDYVLYDSDMQGLKCSADFDARKPMEQRAAANDMVVTIELNRFHDVRTAIGLKRRKRYG